jgi:hypothetical protein
MQFLDNWWSRTTERARGASTSGTVSALSGTADESHSSDRGDVAADRGPTIQRVLRFADWLFQYLQRHTSLQLAIAVGVALAIAYPIMSPSLKAGWSIIDDHEIASSLGPEKHIGPSRFYELFMAGEGGRPGGSSRYRPAYSFARITETMIWANHPGAWFGARLAFFATFLGAIVWVLRRHLSVLENAFLALLIAAFPLWGDIFARLGPGEAYCVLGCALFACGFDLAFHSPLDRKRAIAAGALLWVGGFLALGAKENFAVLLLPAAWLGWRNRKSGLGRWVLASCLVVIAFGIFVEVAAYLGVKNHGHVYKEDISSEGRLAVLSRSGVALWAVWKGYLLATLVVLAAALGALRKRPVERREFARKSAEYAAATVFLALLLLSQHVFYNGRWPSGAYCCARYDFPGLLVAPFAAYTGVSWLRMVFESVGVPRWSIAWLRVGVLVWAVTHVWPTSFPLASASRAVVDSSASFTSKLKEIRRRNREHPGYAFVLESYNVWDYEPVSSLQRFMAMYRVRARIFLKLHYGSDRFATGTLERTLTEEMEKVAAQGDLTGTFAPVQPWSAFHGAPCYAIGFAGGGASTGCTYLLGL